MKNCALYSPLLLELGVPHGFFPPGSPFLLNPGERSFSWEDLRLPRQVHGNTIVDAEEVKSREADGVIATSPGVFVGVATADCIPVILAFPGGVVVLHAGWRGIARSIVERAVLLIRNRFGSPPEKIAVALGPGASGCCYEVGEEVAGALGLPARRMRLDLREEITRRLHKLGVQKVERVGGCTICSGPPWASYRREGKRAERNYAIVGLKG